MTTADENILTSPNLLQSGEFLEILMNRKILEPGLRYKDLTFQYHDKVYKYAEGKVDNKYGGTIIFIFKSEDDDVWSQETINLYMHYEINNMGRLDGKPRISISHRFGGFSEFTDITTNVLDGLVKDILKQLK